MILLTRWLITALAFASIASGLYLVTSQAYPSNYGWYVIGAGVGLLAMASVLEGLDRILERLREIRDRLPEE